jgi:hypothetical protein
MVQGSDTYSHDVKKFADAGLQLRLPVDSIPPNQYARLLNATPVVEGRLEARAGLTLVGSVASGAVHTLYRLNQQIPSLLGERLAGIGSALYSASLAAGSAFTALTGLSFDGTPLTIIDFRFNNDEAAWAIVANGAGMRKRRRPNLYQALGQTAPVAFATAIDNGVGVLNNGAGPGYDWRYTYMNEITRTESNGSPINYAAPGIQRPTANTSPDPIFGGNACTNPANAYDGNTATFAQFVADDGALSSQSCQFTNWASAGTGISGLTLNIDSEVALSAASGVLFVYLYYSTDSGNTWTQIYTSDNTRARTIDTINLPAATDTTQLRLRAAAIYSASTGGGGNIGGSGGGGSTCFSGNTRVVTMDGVKRFCDLDGTVYVRVTHDDGGKRWRKATLVIHPDCKGDLLNMGNGELITPGHHIKAGEYVPAAIIWDERVHHEGSLYNLMIETDRDDEHNYELANGRIAHNINKPSLE